VGIVAAGGTLGILIPPSVVMIIYGIITETSIGALFTAGILPGLLFSLLLSAYVIWRSRRDRTGETMAVAWPERLASLRGVWPIMVLFAAVMGAIYSGIATPTEAAAIGAGAALLLTFGRKGMGFAGLDTVLIRTAQTTAMILLLIICGSFFGFVVAAVGVAHGIVETLTAAQVQPIWVLLGYILVLLILGCFMDPASMLVITLPIAFPVLKRLGFDAVWLGVLVTIAVEVGMITPPVGLNLFVLKGVVPRHISSQDIAVGSLPFVLVLLLGLAIVLAFPGIAVWLPKAVGY
jgi:tripartite ATP-independent transporter DctM subunit